MIDVSTARSIPLLDSLTDAQIHELCRVLRPLSVNANTVVIREGDSGDDMFILLEGQVEISKSMASVFPTVELSQQDKSLIQMSARDNAFFGEMALLQPGSKRMATVTATAKCSFAVLAYSDFADLVRKDVNLGYTVLHNLTVILSQRLSRANHDILKLSMAFSLALER